jgi:hypothetical protein
MADGGRGARLADEPQAPLLVVGELAGEDLQGHASAQLLVLGLVDETPMPPWPILASTRKWAGPLPWTSPGTRNGGRILAQSREARIPCFQKSSPSPSAGASSRSRSSSHARKDPGASHRFEVGCAPVPPHRPHLPVPLQAPQAMVRRRRSTLLLTTRVPLPSHLKQRPVPWQKEHLGEPIEDPPSLGLHSCTSGPPGPQDRRKVGVVEVRPERRGEC